MNLGSKLARGGMCVIRRRGFGYANNERPHGLGFWRFLFADVDRLNACVCATPRIHSHMSYRTSALWTFRPASSSWMIRVCSVDFARLFPC